MAQKNFESFKQWFYDTIKNEFKSEVTDSKIKANICSIINGTFVLSEHRMDNNNTFEKDMNKFLDNMDIRAVGGIVQKIKTDYPKVKIPSKFLNYTIDYNTKGELDLIFTKTSTF